LSFFRPTEWFGHVTSNLARPLAGMAASCPKQSGDRLARSRMSRDTMIGVPEQRSVVPRDSMVCKPVQSPALLRVSMVRKPELSLALLRNCRVLHC